MNMDHLIIFGCVLCPVYCWIMGYISRTNELKFSKLGIVIGTIGILHLSGMAMTGSSSELRLEKENIMTPHSGFTSEGYPESGNYQRLLSTAQRTAKEFGDPPTKNHAAFQAKDGKFSWVTKQEYEKLIKEKK